MDIKLTNGKKIIIKNKHYYERHTNHFEKNGFFPFNEQKKEVKKEIKKATIKDISDKVVQLKPKRKTRKKT